MLKVLMVDYFLPESVYTKELVNEMTENDAVRSVTLYVKEKCPADILGDKAKVINKLYDGGSSNKIIASIKYVHGLMSLSRNVRRNKYHVIHIQGFKNPKHEIPRIMKFKKYCRILVHTVHNILPHENPELDYPLFKGFYDACDLLVVHNDYCRKQLIELFDLPENKVVVMPHGCYSFTHTTEHKWPTDVTTFLQFGNIRHYKGINVLIQAAGMLPEEYKKKTKFIVAGKQFPKLDDTDYQQMAKDAGVENCFEFITDYIEESKLDELYASADFCVFPYIHIYGSGALMMAYSYRKPVIVSDIAAFKEETGYGDTGISFKATDAKALSKAIIEAENLSKGRYDRYVSNIEKLVNNKYNWANSADLLVSAYCSAMKK